MEENAIYNADEFVASPSDAIRRVRERNEVIHITDGESEPMVLLRADKNTLIQLLYDLEVLESLREGIEDVKAGRTMPADEFFEELRRSIKKQ